MVFSSILFLVFFLPVFLLVYTLVGSRAKNYTILLASILFYSWGAPKFVFLLIGSTVVDFYIVRAIYLAKTQRLRKALLVLSITVNLGILLYFKYANFFVANVNGFLNSLGYHEIEWLAVALPIGISFYTFQTLTYSIDVYRKIHAPLQKVTDYLLYIMCFPQLIAGPIVRFNSIADQILERKETVDDKLMGFYRFCIGLAKKVFIANVMAEQADAIFNSDLSTLTFEMAWVGIVAYTFQIYFDFSGYSDMAIGLGRMIGFRFPENFDSPYVSRSISEFWRRWHITLGIFMRDYLYIPLGGNKVSSQLRLYCNLGLVFLLSGLWHGAAWNFLIWGAYHGMFLIFDRLFLLNFLRRIGHIPAMLITLFIVMIGWVIFRLESLDGITAYLNALFSFRNTFDFEPIPAFVFVLILAIIFSFLVSFKVGRRIEQYVFATNYYRPIEHVGWTISSIAIFILALAFITASGFNPFIYFRF